MTQTRGIALVLLAPFLAGSTPAQPYGQPDQGQPGDLRIQQYLAAHAERLDSSFAQDFASKEKWDTARGRFEEEYLYMLGLWPLPPKTPLRATITGSIERDGYVVDLLHYQSKPRLYVTANLYRPASIKPGDRLPAVLYVCGHSSRGRNGNKAAFQSHGIWFARHGYICLVVDTLQLGEIAAIHHGTYREGRWWWHSRGYTPAGVECWNGVRGIDYLVSRPDVDPDRIAVTGISGGGAATFWVAAADERVKAAVPVSGMADLLSYVPNRVINGHCDCMFLYNTFEWPWTRIASLVAPRPMLFVNSDKDPIFPMDANDRVINRLERLYSLFGAGDRVDSLVSIGGHDYRQDIREGVYRFINTHLHQEPRQVTDSEVDLVVDARENRKHPIEPELLRAFPKDSDIPKDELNTTIDQHFVPMARHELPARSRFESWKAGLLAELRRVTFRPFPERIAPATVLPRDEATGASWLETEPGIQIRFWKSRTHPAPAQPKRVLLAVANPPGKAGEGDWMKPFYQEGDAVYFCEPRGVGESRWTTKNPPNYVERSHVLLGRTVDAGRVWDLIATARRLRAEHGGVPVVIAGEGSGALLAAYAALLESEIEGARLHRPPMSHMEPEAPALLNVLRVCDVPEVLGMLAPRSLTVTGLDSNRFTQVSAIYQAAGASSNFAVR